jgi:hypothetical protein
MQMMVKQMKLNRGKVLSGIFGSTTSLGMMIKNIEFSFRYVCVARFLVWMLPKALFHIPHDHYLIPSHVAHAQ